MRGNGCAARNRDNSVSHQSGTSSRSTTAAVIARLQRDICRPDGNCPQSERNRRIPGRKGIASRFWVAIQLHEKVSIQVRQPRSNLRFDGTLNSEMTNWHSRRRVLCENDWGKELRQERKVFWHACWDANSTGEQRARAVECGRERHFTRNFG